MNNITKNYLDLVNALNIPEECNIEISKDNKYIIRIKIDDKLRYIGSKYSVERDVQKFLADIGKIDDNTIIIVFGLGAGEHIIHLLSNLSNTNKVFIFEPCAAVIKEVIKLDDYANILRDDRLALCYADDRIRKNLNDFIKEHNIDNIKVAVFTNYNIIFDKEYELLKNEIESVKKNKKIGNNTLDTFSNLFFNNYIENIFALNEFYTVNYLKDKYKNKPAIIVSAGPSLNKNVHLLKAIQDKFIIITGPRTFGTLVQNGIRPDFLCEVDPQEEVYNFAKDYIDLEIPLVFMDSANSKLVKEQKGLKIIAANQGMENYLEEILGVKVDSIMQGGSVAHFCMGLAVYMGCSTVIFIGQDLAYTNEKFQAEGTYAGEIDELKYRYENNKEEWNRDKNYSIYVNDIYGNKVRTSSILNSYREEFEDLIYSCNGIKFINSTEGGADIKGTELMNLKDSIRLYGIESLNKNLEELLGNRIMPDEKIFMDKMLKIVGKLEVIKKACEDGLEYSDKILNFYKDNKKCDIDKVFRELDRIDSIVNNKEELGFFAYKVVAAINSVLENETFKFKENESEKECGIRVSMKTYYVYMSILQSIDEIIFKININNRKDYLKNIEGNKVITKNKSLIALDMDSFKRIYKFKYSTSTQVEFYEEAFLLKQDKLDTTSNNIIKFKFSVEQSELHLLFINDKNLNILKNDHKYNNIRSLHGEFLDIYFSNGYYEYVFRNKSGIIFRSKLGKYHNNDIEIAIDLNSRIITVNGKSMIINSTILKKHIIKKYIVSIIFSHNKS